MRKVLDWFRFAGPNPYEKMYFDLKAEFMGLSDLNKKMLKDWSKSQASAEEYKAKFEALQKKYDDLYELAYGINPDKNFVDEMAKAISGNKKLSKPLNPGIKKIGEIDINRRRRELDPIDDGDGDDGYDVRPDIPAAVLLGMMLSNTTITPAASSMPTHTMSHSEPYYAGSVNVYDGGSSSESSRSSSDSYSSSSSDSSSSDSSSSSSSGGGGSD